MSESSRHVSRRDFIKTSATTAASLSALAAGGSHLFAQGADTLRVSLIGCGGRGNGALRNCLSAAKYLNMNLKLVSTADWFKDKAENTGEKYGTPKEQCFGGPKAYQKALEADPQMVIMATPPNFRPIHLEACVNAGKHVFMEKPVAVDPPGIRRIIAAGELAKAKGLSIVSGTQRRYSRNYRKNLYAVQNGAIGDIMGGCVWWCMRHLWFRHQKPGESDADYMVRNWVSFAEMSGDHIVEQHIHNIDVANWFLGRPPEMAVGFGLRARRVTGNQYDFFSVDYDYGDGIHIHSMCRQIDGCFSRVSEFFRGSKSELSPGSGRFNFPAKPNLTLPDYEEFEGPYTQEHVALLRSIRENKPVNTAREVAESNMTAIMGRISAYTGKPVRWTDVMSKEDSDFYNLKLTPTAEDFENNTVTAPEDGVFPLPGDPPK